MSLKIGIVGLPNVGKSTLFSALTQKSVDISNYPFCTIEPNIGVVPVTDTRLGKLTEMSKSKKVVPAVVEFVDIAGLVKGAAEGEGLGNKFLSHIREVDAIAEVIRTFEDSDITHVNEKLDPVSDIETVEYELILKDLETVSKRLDSVGRDVRAGKKGAEDESLILEKIKNILEKGGLASFLAAENILEEKQKEWFGKTVLELQLLTAKPLLYIFNISENQLQNNWKPSELLKMKIKNRPYVAISAKIESELNSLAEEEKKEFLDSLNIKEGGLNKLIHLGYSVLGLMTFFTTGEDESRAWTVPQGSTAPRAGRAIHSDFEDKFIRAEVINWQKLLEAGSWSHSREQGILKTVGKDYVIQDGDVIEFKI